MAIWGRYMIDGNVEKIDEGNSAYLVREYAMAFGRDWIIWRGRKRDEPEGRGGRGVVVP